VAEKIAHDLGTPRFALNRVLHRLWRYWAGLKVGSLPSEADVDLRTLFDIADNMAMARIVDGATYRYRFTYFGAVLVKTLGRNPVGAYTQELSRNEYARFLTGLYREVVTTRAGVYTASGFAGAEGLATERLLLPLATDGWNVDAVMAAQTFDRVEDSPTAFDIVERSTRRTDVIERVDRAAAPA
jgi:hypothetical protein